MHSWLRDVVAFVRRARNDLLLVWLALVAFTLGGCVARGEGSPSPLRGGGWGEGFRVADKPLSPDPSPRSSERGDEATARVRLVLAKAKRERQSSNCFTDHAAAVAEARRLKKPLVLWVAVKCSEHTRLRSELSDAVHCHVAQQNRDHTPRIVIEGGDGVEWFVRPDKIGPDTAWKIRAKWRAPSAPLLRRDVGISEEVD